MKSTLPGELAYLAASDALRLFRTRALSPLEYLDAQIARIEAHDLSINAIHTRLFESAREQAIKAEQIYMLDGKNARPLEGLPVLVKNEMEIMGVPMDWGSRLMAGSVASRTTPMVQLLIDAGAVIHGTTHVPEISMAAFVRTRLHGVTHNPWERMYSPGGSSGGSGAALAAGMSSLATGSDVGGSIRIPASQCGLVGFKASHGRVPVDPGAIALHGHVHNGVMSRSIEDCVLAFNVVNGPHGSDPTTLRPKLEIPHELPEIRGTRIALSTDLGHFVVDPRVVENTLEVGRRLQERGAIVERVDFGFGINPEQVWLNAMMPVLVPFLKDLASGRENDLCDYIQRILERDREDGPRSLLASQEGAAIMYSSLEAQVFSKYDALLCPTMARTDALAEGVEDSFDNLFQTCMTYPFNTLSRHPALSVPSGFTDSGVPSGVQIVAKTFDDLTSLALGMALQRSIDWPSWRPKL